jgi:hypothetical protein
LNLPTVPAPVGWSNSAVPFFPLRPLALRPRQESPLEAEESPLENRKYQRPVAFSGRAECNLRRRADVHFARDEGVLISKIDSQRR